MLLQNYQKVHAVSGLLKPESKAALTGVLTYHVVAGKFEAAAVLEAIKANDGMFKVATVQGGEIILSLDGGSVILTDANGGKSTVVIADVVASNGVIHAVDIKEKPLFRTTAVFLCLRLSFNQQKYHR